jgi:flagella basal body P-ring formation protein FlgA
MRALLYAAVVLVASGLSAAVAWAEPVLKEQALVEHDMIQLGDLFANLPPAIDPSIEVGRAPAPGMRLTVDASALLNIANSQRIGWHPGSRFDHVIVERAGQVISPAAIHDAVAKALAKLGMPQGAEIALDNERLQITVPSDRPATVRADAPLYDPTKPRFEVTLIAPADDIETNRVSIRTMGKIYRMADVPVLSRPVATGEVIRARDIEMVRMRVEQLGATAINDPDKLVDKAARHVLPAGQPIRVSDIQSPVLVAKNSIVTVKVQTARLSITMQAKALDDGAEGDTVRTINTRSDKIVQGVVSGRGEIVVTTAYSVAPTSVVSNN